MAKFEIKIPCTFLEFEVNKLCYETDILNYLRFSLQIRKYCMLNKISKGGPVIICCLDGGVGGGSENYIFVTPLIVFYRSFLIVSRTFHYPLPTEEV